MLDLGIKLTDEDMARIVSSVAAMSLNLIKNGNNLEDHIEAAELFKLHLKLVKAVKDATRKNFDNGCDEN